MNSQNTYALSDRQFVDSYGFFTLRKENSFLYDVPKEMHTGKLSQFRGCKVRLTVISTMHYGNIIQFEATKLKSKDRIKKVDLNEFKFEQKKFSELQNWNKTKRDVGINFFKFLRSHNPIYLQKSKDWIKEMQSGSKKGDYVVLRVAAKIGLLKPYDGMDCLFVVTYNKGYKNGFMVIPVKD